jgi:hypothetical protein
MRASLTIVFVAFLGLAASPGPVAAVDDGSTEHSTPVPPGSDWQSVTTEADGDRPTVSDRGDGRYRIHVSRDPRMIVDLDLSLLRAPLDPGALTMSTEGAMDGERVVSVAVGVRFAGVGDAITFLQDPFERFEVVSRSTLSLPFPTNTSAITNASAPTTVPALDGRDAGNASEERRNHDQGDRR